MSHIIKYTRGFTLIELIVAMGIFAFAATFAVASLLALTGVQRKAAATQDAFDNVRYAVEFMAKETREAKTIENNCLNNSAPTFVCDVVILRRGVGNLNTVTYSWDADAQGRRVLYREEQDSGNLVSKYPLTDGRIHINHASFYISNAASIGDDHQPYVIFVINATAGDPNKPSEQSTIHLQTAASLWRLDMP